MKDITFHNVTITLSAETPEQAYTILCNALDQWNGEWWTDKYSVDGGRLQSTTKIFPKG